jgi:hypothetical protein
MANKPKKPQIYQRTGWAAFVDGLALVVDRFGWPGAVLTFGFYFVQTHATIEQKHEIIDNYVLGKGFKGFYPYLILGGMFLLTFAAQQKYWSRRVKVLKEEVDRLSKWKTDIQQSTIGADLHHTKKG